MERFYIVALALLSCLACGCTPSLDEQTTETVTIESVDLPGVLWDPLMPPLVDGSPVDIDGQLTIPATDDPVPAVIITHGCGGAGGAERGWVDDLVNQGIAVLLLDSFGGRGIESICFGGETVSVASIVVDLFRTVEALQDNPYIDGSRIAVMGFSFGGRTALWSSLTRFQDEYDGQPLKAHIAFYPSTCFIRLENESDVNGGPIRIFQGTEDDWTPIGPCQAYVDRISADGVDAELFAFAGAHHSFDNETLGIGGVAKLDAPSPRSCEFVEVDGEIIDPDTGMVAGVGSPCVELGVTYGYNAAAHAEAKGLVIEFLSRVFQLR